MFINTTVNEPLPISASSDFQKFINMTEEGRIQEAENMTQQEKQMIMTEAKVNNTVIENISMTTTQETANKTLAGTFVGAGDGFHNAEG